MFLTTNEKSNYNSILNVADMCSYGSTTKSQVRGVGEGHGTTHFAANVIYADNEALRNPQYAITNTSGQAELKLPSKGICYYKVTYIGYVPVTGKIGGTGCT